MLSSSPSKIHEPRVTGVSPRPTDSASASELRNTRAVENDFAELKGIGQKHAATLKEIGVGSIMDLRIRNASYSW